MMPALALVAAIACSFAAVALGAEGELNFIGAEKDGVGGVDGLAFASGVSTSPDGKHVYVASAGENAVAAFARDPASGELSFVEAERDAVAGVDGLDGATGVSTSPDGKHVYVASGVDNAVAAFTRNPATGTLDFVGAAKEGVGGVEGLEGAYGVTASPDGKNIYVASFIDAALAAFTRDPTTGALTFVEAETDEVGGVKGLSGAIAVSASPDGKNVYVASQFDAALAAFARNPASGELDFVEAEKDGVDGVDGLTGASGVSTSPDGENVYVASAGDDAVAAFSRDPADGAVNFIEATKDGVGGVDGLDGAFGISTSPDGKSVYVGSFIDDALAAFSRSPATGALDFIEAEKDGVGGVDGLNGAVGVSASPDGESVYVAARDDNALAAFARDSRVVEDGVDGSAGAEEVQRQKGSHVVIKARVTAAEALSARATGRVVVGNTSYRLRPKRKQVATGKSKILKLRPKRSRDAKRIVAALKNGKKTRAKLKVKLTDALGNEKTTKLLVELER